MKTKINKPEDGVKNKSEKPQRRERYYLAKVKPDRRPKYHSFVEYREGGKRHRKPFAFLQDAQKFAKAKHLELLEHGSGQDIGAAERAVLSEMRSDIAATGASLREILVAGIRAVGVRGASGALGELVDAFLAAPHPKASEETMRGLRHRLPRFVSHFGADTAADSISPEDVIAFLAAGKDERTGKKWSKRTVRIYRGAIRQLYLWAARAKKCQTNPINEDTVVEVPDGERAVLTPEQLVRYLQAADESLLPLIAIESFTGVRPSEALRLRWGDIDWMGGVIKVNEREKGKSGKRDADIGDNLREWLRPHVLTRVVGTPDELIAPLGTRRLLTDARRRAGLLPWPQDCLRRSFGSCHFKWGGDLGRTASKLGHIRDAQILKKHYLNTSVGESDAGWYFKIQPGNLEEVLAGIEEGRKEELAVLIADIEGTG